MKAYFAKRSLPGLEVRLRNAQPSPIRISGLRPAEEALFDLSIRLRRDLEPKEAADVAGDIRRRADDFPRDPFALQLIARATLQVGKFPEAVAAADRLLAVQPGSAAAMLVKGAALARMAKDKKDATDPLWREARNWLIKANDAQRDDPEILYEYFQSFANQGISPPADATDALVHAFQLYPQNTDLRLAAAKELHRVKRFQEALAVLKPLANDPHQDGEKNGADALLKELQQTVGIGGGKG
jgi:tetratricopeptide (TPR) repeat protein